MGLFDEYLDPDQFQASGGLLGRLLSLQQQQGQYQPSADFDRTPTAPPAPAPLPMPSPMLANYGQMSAVVPMPAQDLGSQYATLAPILGDHNAMVATVNPEIGKTMIAQALAGSTKPGNTGGADPSGNGPAGPGNEASSIAGGQPPGVSQVGYFEAPVNANQAFGELSDNRERNVQNTVSGEDYLSGVREGNVRQNEDGSLDVTNGTVVTVALKGDRRAKTVIVTNTDIAHIDGKTGEVVKKKSPFGDGI